MRFDEVKGDLGSENLLGFLGDIEEAGIGSAKRAGDKVKEVDTRRHHRHPRLLIGEPHKVKGVQLLHQVDDLVPLLGDVRVPHVNRGRHKLWEELLLDLPILVLVASLLDVYCGEVKVDFKLGGAIDASRQEAEGAGQEKDPSKGRLDLVKANLSENLAGQVARSLPRWRP